MNWWLWVVLGLALLGIEIMTPGGFFVLFFGIAALAVAGFTWLGMVTSAAAQWLSFSILSVASLLLFRRRLVRWLRPDQASAPAVDSLVGEIAIPLEDLAPGAVGKAELRGTAWSVRNIDAHMIRQGTRCRVEQVSGLMLDVRAE